MTELSRRDQFAMAALPELINRISDYETEHTFYKFVAMESVKYADALIAELDKTEKKCLHTTTITNFGGPTTCGHCGEVLK